MSTPLERAQAWIQEKWGGLSLSISQTIEAGAHTLHAQLSFFEGVKKAIQAKWGSQEKLPVPPRRTTSSVTLTPSPPAFKKEESQASLPSKDEPEATAHESKLETENEGAAKGDIQEQQEDMEEIAPLFADEAESRRAEEHRSREQSIKSTQEQELALPAVVPKGKSRSGANKKSK